MPKIVKFINVSNKNWLPPLKQPSPALAKHTYVSDNPIWKHWTHHEGIANGPMCFLWPVAICFIFECHSKFSTWIGNIFLYKGTELWTCCFGSVLWFLKIPFVQRWIIFELQTECLKFVYTLKYVAFIVIFSHHPKIKNIHVHGILQIYTCSSSFRKFCLPN